MIQSTQRRQSIASVQFEAFSQFPNRIVSKSCLTLSKVWVGALAQCFFNVMRQGEFLDDDIIRFIKEIRSPTNFRLECTSQSCIKKTFAKRMRLGHISCTSSPTPLFQHYWQWSFSVIQWILMMMQKKNTVGSGPRSNDCLPWCREELYTDVLLRVWTINLLIMFGHARNEFLHESPRLGK